MATPISPIGSKRAQNDPKKAKIQKKSENKKSFNMKIFSVYELTSKTNFRPYINPKPARHCPKKAQNDPTIPQNQKVRKQKIIQNEGY